jgi:peptide/nickel transport system permease protein
MGCSIRAFVYCGVERMQITVRSPLIINSRIRLRRWLAALARLPRLSSAVILAVVLSSLGAGFLTSSVLPEANQIDLRFRYAPPWPLAGSSPAHLLGTDRLGRDLLSRMLVGAQNSLAVALLAIAFAASVGTSLGLMAGYLGGWVDGLIMRCVDIMMSFPAILVALVFVVTIGASFGMVVATLALLLWAQYTRLVRGQVLSLKERDFVALAQVAGCSTRHILTVHILHNIVNSVVVLATLQIGWGIVVESALSFLGAGVPPPAPTWGNLVAEGRDVLDQAWWVALCPGLAIMLVVLSFNLFGDWVRDTLDPKLRQL